MNEIITLRASSQTDLQYEIINHFDFGYLPISEITKDKNDYIVTLKLQKNEQ